MSYPRLLERLFAARRAGVQLGLERMAGCLASLGHPERGFVARGQIGGTNGKGSTAAFAASMARAAGRRVGLYTSPHLCSLRERFLVDGALPGEEEVVAAAAAIAAAGGDALTFFEQTSAIAARLFADAGVEVALFEVGLGGRFDATTAIPCEVAAVTGVALDHQEWLGSSLPEIAAEKGAIFAIQAGRPEVASRGGLRIVVGSSGEPDGTALLVAAARAARPVALTIVDAAAIAALPSSWPLGLAGAHQRANAAAALAIVDHLEARGVLAITPAQRRDGLAAVRHPGRFETVAARPRVSLDGAHNPHGAGALAAALGILAERPRVVVLAVSADKDAAGIARALAPACEGVIATRYQQARSLAPALLAAAVGAAAPGLPVVIAAELGLAMAQARAQAGPDGVIVVCGSLFLVGEAHALLCGTPVDPVLLSDPIAPESVVPSPGQ